MLPASPTRPGCPFAKASETRPGSRGLGGPHSVGNPFPNRPLALTNQSHPTSMEAGGWTIERGR